MPVGHFKYFSTEFLNFYKLHFIIYINSVILYKYKIILTSRLSNRWENWEKKLEMPAREATHTQMQKNRGAGVQRILLLWLDFESTCCSQMPMTYVHFTLRNLMKIISASILHAISFVSIAQHSNQCSGGSLTFEWRRRWVQRGDTCRGQHSLQSAPFPLLTKEALNSLLPARNSDKDGVCIRSLIVTAFPIKPLNCRLIRHVLITQGVFHCLLISHPCDSLIEETADS